MSSKWLWDLLTAGGEIVAQRSDVVQLSPVDLLAYSTFLRTEHPDAEFRNLDEMGKTATCDAYRIVREFRPESLPVLSGGTHDQLVLLSMVRALENGPGIPAARKRTASPSSSTPPPKPSSPSAPAKPRKKKAGKSFGKNKKRR